MASSIKEAKNMKRKVWKGGPRSSRSYKLDQYRIAKDEPKVKGWRKKHYRTVRGRSHTVKGHRIRRHRR